MDVGIAPRSDIFQQIREQGVGSLAVENRERAVSQSTPQDGSRGSNVGFEARATLCNPVTTSMAPVLDPKPLAN